MLLLITVRGLNVMVDIIGIMRKRAMNALYTPEKSNALEYFDKLMHIPISYYIPPQVVYNINKLICSLKYSDQIAFKKQEILRMLKPYGFFKFGSGTNRIVLQHYEDPTIILKVALDRVGINDNPNEYYNQFLLKPFVPKMFDVTPCGTIAMCEKVKPITNIDEFMSIAEDVFLVIVHKIIGKYVASDIGTKWFMNWGVRAGFGPVLLDSPYLYVLDGASLYCNDINPMTNQPCMGEIDYDAGFNYLICTKCGKQYSAADLKIKHAKEQKLIITKGGNSNMSIKVMYGDEVISESNNLKSTDYIKNPKDSRPFYDRKKILEPVGKNTTGIKVSLTYGGEPFTNEIKIVNKHNKKEECKPIVKPRIVMPTDAVSAPVEKSIEKAPIKVAEPEVVTTTESNIVDTSTSNTETKTYPNEFKPDESEAKEVKVTTIEEYKPIDGVTIKEEYSKPEEDHSTEDVEIANPVDDETVIKDELVYKKITMPPENEESSSIMGNEGFNSLPPEMQELLMNQD
jgi:hypothetical protein